MKNALILHGAGNNSQGNWFPWLSTALENNGYDVWSPDLPNSDVPDKTVWLQKILSNHDWDFNEESVLVGHSAGATLILRILERLPEGKQIKLAILVAGVVQLGTKPDFFPYKRSLVEDPFRWKKIKQSAKEFYFFHSDNDPYECGVDQGKIMLEHLGGNLKVKPGQGHFNLEKGPQYKHFPELIQIICHE